MQKTSLRGVILIKTFEGFSALAYICPAGYKTIGYGHVVRSDETFTQAISKPQALELLQRDLKNTECSVLRLICVPLQQNQFDALVSFTYNLGAGALQRSTLRRKINRLEHQAAVREFSRWVWAGGRKLKGLVLRRQAEALLYSR